MQIIEKVLDASRNMEHATNVTIVEKIDLKFVSLVSYIEI